MLATRRNYRNRLARATAPREEQSASPGSRPANARDPPTRSSVHNLPLPHICPPHARGEFLEVALVDDEAGIGNLRRDFPTRLDVHDGFYRRFAFEIQILHA